MELGITDLPRRALHWGLVWHGLPIADGRAPDDRFLQPWSILEGSLAESLLLGNRVVVHCKGGLGRAGTVASLLLLATGASANAGEAIQRVRSERPGAIETIDQEVFLQQWIRPLRKQAD